MSCNTSVLTVLGLLFNSMMATCICDVCGQAVIVLLVLSDAS